MRAIIQDTFGGPEVLRLADVPDPAPLPTEAVVRVKAIGINPVETYIRAGRFPFAGQPPIILGWDISGVVESVVPGTNRFVPGDEVFGMPLFPRAAKAYAELVAAPSRQLARKPAALSHSEAAAASLAGLTAWQCLVDVAGVRNGDRVLIHAAAGGVGHLAVQIAKAKGAYVIGTASTGKCDFVRALGADEVIDYRSVDFAETVRDIDVVLEMVGGEYGERSLKALKPGGLLVTIVDRLNRQLAEKVGNAGRRFAGVTVEPDHIGLEALAAMAEAGKLKVHVDKAFPLEEAAKAHRFLFEAKPRGKIVLTP
jgi:NADPH:quinone reductase-like Zn-dependent oxidoreductase